MKSIPKRRPPTILINATRSNSNSLLTTSATDILRQDGEQYCAVQIEGKTLRLRPIFPATDGAVLAVLRIQPHGSGSAMLSLGTVLRKLGVSVRVKLAVRWNDELGVMEAELP